MVWYRRYNRSGTDQIHDVKEYFDHIYNSIFTYDQNRDKNLTKVKIDYYKRYLNSDQVYIEGISDSTTMDGKYDYYSGLIKDRVNGTDRISSH